MIIYHYPCIGSKLRCSMKFLSSYLELVGIALTRLFVLAPSIFLVFPRCASRLPSLLSRACPLMD